MNLTARLSALERAAPPSEPLVVLVHVVTPGETNREAETATIAGLAFDRMAGEAEADYLGRLAQEARRRAEVRVIVNA